MSAARAVTFAADDRKFVYAVARRIVGSPDEAEDCAQDAMLLAYRHRDSFRADSQYRTWLYRIAATTALGHLRQQRRSRLRLVTDEDERQALERRADPAKPADSCIEEAEERELVQEAVSQLPVAYREVLIARADASEQEVATKLGISVANVKIRAHRARKLLRDAIVRLEAR